MHAEGRPILQSSWNLQHRRIYDGGRSRKAPAGLSQMFRMTDFFMDSTVIQKDSLPKAVQCCDGGNDKANALGC